jgi:hypothetical protein
LRFKDIEDQLIMQRQQWQADQQKQSIEKMAGKISGKSNEEKKIVIEIITIQIEDAVVLAKAIPAKEDVEDMEEAVEDASEGETTVII